jgi:hypothetical protein
MTAAEAGADGCLIAGYLLIVSGVYVLAGLGWALIAAGLMLGWVGARSYRGGGA